MKVSSEQEMYDLGKHFSNQARVIELIGDVGAGKTTFTRGLAAGLGITTPVTSPSFTISKSYACPDGRTLTHYDFYRLPDPGIMTADLAEHIKNGDIVVIEWGESIKNILPKNRTIVTIHTDADNSRSVEIHDHRISAVQDILQPTRNESAENPVTTSATKHIENNTNRLPLYLDTSTATTILKLDDTVYEWTSGHDLAEKLLSFIESKLSEHGKSWYDISEITFMSGPGSFTGLRIGAAVVNTLAHELHIPLYDHHGKKHDIILPKYGRPANITAPKK